MKMKSKGVYVVLTWFSALCPFNRMYLGEPWLVRLFTLNYCALGWVFDLPGMGRRFDETMAKRGYVHVVK